MSIKKVHRASALAIAAIACVLALAAPALARTIPLYTYTGKYYDGAGSTAGTLAFGNSVAIDQVTNDGYVTDPARMDGSFSKFDADGKPAAFSALEGATAIALQGEGAEKVKVDNSATPSQGDILVIDAKGVVRGYRRDGLPIGESFPIGGLQDGCSMAVDAEGDVWGVDPRRSKIVEYSSSGEPTGRTISFPSVVIGAQNSSCDLAIDSNDNFYLTIFGFASSESFYAKKYDSDGNYLYDFAGGYVQAVAVDRSNNHVFTLEPSAFANGEFDSEVVEYDENGERITSFGAPDAGNSFLGLTQPQGLDVNQNTHRIYVNNPRDYEGRQHVEIFTPSGQALVPTTRTEAPQLSPTEATLKGSIDLDGGGDATSCYFEWGNTFVYGQTAPCEPAAPVSGPGVHQVTAHLTGLTQGARYHYRLVAKNGNGIPALGSDRGFRPQGPASIGDTLVSDVNTDGARISTTIDPHGGDTTYRVEYGTEECSLGGCASAPLPAATLRDPLGAQEASVVLSGLGSDTAYHYRVVAKNEYSEVAGDEGVLRTYAVDSTADTCPNALIRKETGTVLLPDCRAYELVSAANSGGYDVTSDLVPGQVPLPTKPRAADRIIYSLNYGKVPGVGGEPPNHGDDPYVATRGPDGWSTGYAGISVGDPPAQDPFGSAPLDESEDLSTFVFGGPEICDPCFDDGKAGLPVRRDGAPLTQGMAGAVDPGPTAEPDGYIARSLSPDGTHLIFGSASAFEEDANTNGDVSIYDRNLITGVTHVVSKAPGGGNLPCLQGAGSCHGPGNADGIASLDVSADGSRVIVAQRVATDAAGNRYWHPYMNIGDSATTVDLAPGAGSGVLYDGMAADGSSVLYTTVDKLTSDDHDSSADVYRADVSSAGDVQISRVSTGSGAGDSDACDPAAAAGRNNWNAVGAASPNRCGAVAFAGGAGVARAGGAIYFLSPEKLDGSSGVLNQPNLYFAAAGEAPRFVATLEASNPAISDAVEDSEARGFGDIQVTPDGRFAAFASATALTGFPAFGHTAIYRYDSGANDLVCASCPTTGAALTSDTGLSRFGLNLADDGRVLFTSTEPLALRDTGGSADVYEWKGGRIFLISTGRSPTATGLLSASADGRNAFFYTRDVLAGNDHNGNTIKIYTAREQGGYAIPAALQECQASDECHGPGSVAPPAEVLPTFQGTGGNAKPAAKRKKPKRACRRRGKHRRKRHCARKHRHRHGGKSRRKS
jgi:hypothetical protein